MTRDLPELTDAVTVQNKSDREGAGPESASPATPGGRSLSAPILTPRRSFLEGTDVADFTATLPLLEKKAQGDRGTKKHLKIDADGGLAVINTLLMVHDAGQEGRDSKRFIFSCLRR